MDYHNGLLNKYKILLKWIYVSRRAKSLQSECTAYSISKPKLKLQKSFVNLSPLTFGHSSPHPNVCPFAPIPTFAPLPPSQGLPPLPPTPEPPSPIWPFGTPPTPEPHRTSHLTQQPPIHLNPPSDLVQVGWGRGLVQLGFYWRKGIGSGWAKVGIGSGWGWRVKGYKEANIGG